MAFKFTSNYIFKFTPIDAFTFPNLILQRLWFNSPSQMNDQFEGHFNIVNPDFNPSKEAIINFLKYNKLYDEITLKQIESSGFVDYFTKYSLHIKTKKYGMTCFSREYNEQLLWAHYADKNQGICLVYDEQLLFDNLKSIYEIKQCNVSYDKKPSVTLYERNAKIEFSSNVDLVSAKSNCWKYEKETRFYFDSIDDFHGTSIVVGALPLRAIIYGYHISDINKEAFSDLIRNDEKYRHVKEYCVDINYKKAAFEIRPHEQ